MSTALVIGASRGESRRAFLASSCCSSYSQHAGLGLELAKTLHARGHKVFATTRSPPSSDAFPNEINIISGIDVGEENAGSKIAQALKGTKLDVTIINAGLFKPEVSLYSFACSMVHALTSLRW